MPSTQDRDKDGDVILDENDQPVMTRSYWSLLEGGVPKGAPIYGSYDSPEALDEITKFVTETGGKYKTYKINTPHIPSKAEHARLIKKEKYKDLKLGQVIYYQGKGGWDVTKHICQITLLEQKIYFL